MAALSRPSQATYEVHDQMTVDTSDNEDHTFCGIMFPIKCKDLLPLHHLVINSVAVRGHLGPMTVWMYTRPPRLVPPPRQPSSSTSIYSIPMRGHNWIKVYEKTHVPSPRKYQKLEFTNPIIVQPGQVIVLYIHSSAPGDQAIVYDNARVVYPNFGRSSYFTRRSAFLTARQHQQQQYQQQQPFRRETVADQCLEILSARAHVSNVPFGKRPIWGWGHAWRDDREFVGRVEYGCVYQLWNPNCHVRFANKFRQAVQTALMCQRKFESPWSWLPDDCIYYIFNMCRHDWFQDDVEDYQQLKRQRKQSALEKQQSVTSMNMVTTTATNNNDAGTIAAAAAVTALGPPITRNCNTHHNTIARSYVMLTDAPNCSVLRVDNHNYDNGDENHDDNNDSVYDPNDNNGVDQDDDDDDDDNGNEEEDEEEGDIDEDEDLDEDDDDSDDMNAHDGYFRFTASSDNEGDNRGAEDDDDEEDDDEDADHDFDGTRPGSRAWMRQRFLHAFRALASGMDHTSTNSDVEMNT